MGDCLTFGPRVRLITAGPGGVIVTDDRGARRQLTPDQRVLDYGSGLAVVGKHPATRRLKRLWRRWRGVRSLMQARHFIKTRLRMEQTTESNSIRDAAVRGALITVAGNIAWERGVKMSTRTPLCLHEAAHAIVRIALGDPLEPIGLYVGPKGGLCSVGLVGDEEAALISEENSDDNKIARTNAALVEWGLEPLDLGEIHREAAAILKRNWLFTSIVANLLEQRCAMAPEARISGDELNRMWHNHKIRETIENKGEN